MENKKLTTSLVAGLLIATNLYSNELSSVTVTSPLIKTNEIDATYSTEVYTKNDIEKSKSKDIYDFLNSQTSVNIAPSYGNTFTQLIDIRGYGTGNGHENVVVSVNGRRLNNIDLAPQLLSSIPLDSIEKIEVIKGSGSVQYGDGANSGVINIITNGKNENYIKTYFGNNGVKNGTASFGYSNDNLILNGFLDYTSADGNRSLSSGEKNDNYNRNKKFNIIYFPTDNLELRLGKTYSKMNIKYGGSLTLDQYKEDPRQVPSSFTNQYFSSNVTEVGLTYDINRKYSIDINYNDENKISQYKGRSPYRYDYKSYNSKLKIKDDKYKLVFGVDGFNGDREESTNITTKDNKALFVSTEFNFNSNLTFSTGLRRENVEYTYSPNTGSELNDEMNLNAFDFGVNYKLDDNNSFFANYNKSYQAPAIDRFFKTSYSPTVTKTFNGFIKPTKVNNYSLGYTNIQKNNKLKISLFRSDLRDELYLEPVTYNNRNIDKSHKYGIELYDKYLINKDLYTSLNYSYIIAKIDEEDEGNGAYDGKYLPGVSKHNLTVNLGYNYNRFNTVLSHTYRSSAYAANDFENNFSQKQEPYHSTDVSFSYDYKNFEFFAKIQNLFDQDNGIWIRDNGIYPVNFERTYQAGVKYKF